MPAGAIAVAAGVMPLSFTDEATAQTATWIGGTSSDYHTDSNWSPAAVPNSTAIDLLFGPAALNTTISALAGSNAAALVFEAGASSFVFNIGPAATGFGLHGDGIVNNSGVIQTINLNNAGLIMNNNASMGGNIVVNLAGTGQIDFKDTSSGGLAAFNLNGSAGVLIDGSNHAVSMGSLSGTGFRIQFSGPNQSLTVGGNNQSTSYSGQLWQTSSGTNASLIKVGTGTLTLSGTTNYSGGTTISGGTLSVSSNGHLGASSGALTLNGGALRVTGTTFNSTSRSITLGSLGGGIDIANAANNLSILQGISGPGGLTKTGAGTLRLQGNNTYAGATTVSAGRLLVNGSIASSSLTTVEAGGTLGGSGTLGNTSVNAGGILSAGNSPGTLTVAGDLTLNAGSISVFEFGAPGVVGGASNDLVVVTGNLSLGGTLQTPGAVSGYYRLFNVGGSVNGAFSTVPAGATVSLDIPNQVNMLVNQGGQRVQFWDGVDQVGNGTVDGGAGTWNAANTNWTGAPGQAGINDQWRGEVGVFAGAPGTVTASGALSFQGLQFTTNGYHLAGDPLTMTGDPHGNATASFVNVDGGVTAAISAPLTGAGIGLDKLGNGTLILAGSHAYTGATTVKNGSLLVNGSIASSSLTTVEAGGTLGGDGTVGNTLINGGTLAPGNNGIGTLTVQGNLTLTAASRYMVDINPANSDSTRVTGTATLGGATVAAQFAPGSYVERRYTILTANGGVNGTFAGPAATNLPTNFTTALSYDGSNAWLDLALSFRQSGLSSNQQNVANTLADFFNSNGGIPLAFGALDARGLSQASGEIATAAAQGAFDAQNQFLNTMTDPFVAGAQTPYPHSSPALGYAAEAPRRRGDARDAFASLEPPPASGFEQRWRIFGAAYGGSTQISGNSAVGSHDVNSQVYGGTGGATYALSPSTNVGFALNGGGTAFGLADGLGSGRSDLFQAGAFAQQAISRSGYLNTALSYGWHDVNTDRTAPITGERLRANYRAGVLAGRIEAGWRIETPLAGVIPYAAAQAVSYRMPSYIEKGDGSAASFALGYMARNILATRSEFGLRFDHTTPVNEALLTFRGRAAWAHYFDTVRNAAATFQSLPGTGFVVNGATIAPDAALVTAGTELAWRNGFSLASSFEGEFSGNVTSFIGRGTLRYAW